MQIDLRLNIARLLSRVQKHLRKLDAKVDVVGTSRPLEAVCHLLFELSFGHDFVCVQAVRPLEVLVDDEGAVNDGVQKSLLLPVETFTKGFCETLAVRVWIAATRKQPALAASPRYTVYDSGRRDGVAERTLSVTCGIKSSSSTSIGYESTIF